MANSPYSETIISAIVTACEGITEQAGYNNTVQVVYRHGRNTGDAGDRPSIRVRHLTENYDSASESERQVTLTVEILGKIKYDPHDEDATDIQSNRFAFDIEYAIANIGYESVDYDLNGWSKVLLSEEDDMEPVDGVRIIATFTYSVDWATVYTITGP